MRVTLRSLFVDTAVVAVLFVMAKDASNPVAFTVFMSLVHHAQSLTSTRKPRIIDPSPGTGTEKITLGRFAA